MFGKKLLFIAYGDLAERTASVMLKRGYDVTAMSRSSRIEPSGEYPGVWRHWKADITAPETAKDVACENFDAIVITLTPDDRSDEGYKKSYVDSLYALSQAWSAQNGQTKLVIFVSSTGVYGQNDGQWVTEQSVTSPSQFTGKRLLEAEQLVKGLRDASGQKILSTVLRFSGIYGPGRYHLLDRVKKGDVSGENYTNRIHVDDCVGVISHLLNEYFHNNLYFPTVLATDSDVARSSTVKKWLAEQLKKQGVPVKVAKENETIQACAGGKRCSNALLLNIGYTFTYPSYKLGFTDIINQYCKKHFN